MSPASTWAMIFLVELAASPIRLRVMRWMLIPMFLFSLCIPAFAAGTNTGRIVKVLPQFLDLQGRTSITPSLYERDIYQAELHKHPERISGLLFNVQWKTARASGLKLRVETRGTVRDKTLNTATVELPVKRSGAFSQWEKLYITGDEYKRLGSMTAWHVTLWDGESLLSEQKSFLW